MPLSRRREAPPLSAPLLAINVPGAVLPHGSARSTHKRIVVGGARVPWLGVLFTLAWMCASAAAIFANKVLMVDRGFAYPFAISSLGQLSSLVFGALHNLV